MGSLSFVFLVLLSLFIDEAPGRKVNCVYSDEPPGTKIWEMFSKTLKKKMGTTQKRGW